MDLFCALQLALSRRSFLPHLAKVQAIRSWASQVLKVPEDSWLRGEKTESRTLCVDVKSNRVE